MPVSHATFVLWCGVVWLIHCECRGSRRTSDSCVYNFEVWKPGKEAEKRLQEVESSTRDVREMVTSMGNVKAEVYRDLNGLYNNTMILQRESLEQKLQITDLMLKYKTIASQMLGIDKSVQAVDTIALHNKVEVSQIRHTNTSLPADILAQLKNSMGNLKAEWMLLKRQVHDVRSESYKLKFGQNEIEMERRKTSDRLKELKNNTEYLISAYDELHKDNSGHRKRADSTELDLNKIKVDQSEIKYDLQLLEEDVKVMKNDVLAVQKELTVLKIENTNIKHDFRQISQNSAGSGTFKKTDAISTETTTPSVSGALASTNHTIPIDCQDVLARGYRTSGAYEIQPSSTTFPDRVYCEMVGQAGWTVIQRRVDGLTDFNRRWLEYKYGFGNIYGEFWLGNERIHALSKSRSYRLRVDMWDWEGNRAYAEYDHFKVDSEESKYRVHVRGYSGDAGDSLEYHNSMAFSTEDVDNDLKARHCAMDYKSGWWFEGCYMSNLNGIYRVGWYNKGGANFADGIIWYTLKDDDFYSLKSVEMKIRPV